MRSECVFGGERRLIEEEAADPGTGEAGAGAGAGTRAAGAKEVAS